MTGINFLFDCLPTDVVAQIEAVTPGEQQAIAAALCRLALTRTGLDDPLAVAGLRLLEAGTCGLRGGSFTSDLRKLSDRLHLEYFDAKDRQDAGLVDEATVRKLRGRARLADAICFGLEDEDPSVAAHDSIYDSTDYLTDDEIRACICQELARLRKLETGK